MNGYTISAALDKTYTTTFGQNRLMARRAVNAQMTGRIYQPSPYGGEPKQVPSRLADVADKTPVSHGAASYAEFRKGSPRAIELDTWEALEVACASLAPKLVELMVMTAREIN